MPRVSLSILEALRGHELLPPAAGDSLPDAAFASTGNLLPGLIGVWEQAVVDSDRSTVRRRGQANLVRLRQAHAAGAVLTCGVAGTEPLFEDLVGQRLIWWPRGLPAGERVAVISSRLGRWGKLPPHWFATLRRVLEEVESERQTLVAARETALAELIECWADLRRVPRLTFDVSQPRQSLQRWWTECLRTATRVTSDVPGQFLALVSPPLSDTPTALIPARDAVLVAVSDRVVVCQVRPQGNVWRLLEQRLAREGPFARCTTTILTGSGFTSHEAAESLQQRGARLQAVAAGETTLDPVPYDRTCAVTGCSEATNLVTALPAFPALVHCTRAIEGPWPDQVRSDYLAGLLWGDADSQRTPLTTLARIVCQEKLLATGRAIRGKQPVVCFTDVDLRDLPALRRFRTHRSRWDFEPYGMAICRDWLVARGARPVIYGDDAAWEHLDAVDRPFFQ